MRALVVPEPGRVELADVPVPTPGPYQALVQTEVCGICSSTDWKIINGQMTWAGPCPLVLGHESVGRVVEVGSRVRNLKTGDRVTRVVVPKTAMLNAAMGGFAEYGIVTDARAMAADGDRSMLDDYTAQRQLVVSPVLKDPLHAALAISLAETASVLATLPSLRNQRVLVAGTGVAGLALTLWAKLAGADVTTLGRRADRLAIARRVGADATVNTSDADWSRLPPFDGVIEAIGDVAFAATLLTLLKPDGFASAYGAPPDGRQFDARWRIPDVREQDGYGWVADLLARQWVRPEWFVTHQWPLDEAVDAFNAVRRGDVIKGFIRLP